jgi:hypothetical protein
MRCVRRRYEARSHRRDPNLQSDSGRAERWVYYSRRRGWGEFDCAAFSGVLIGERERESRFFDAEGWGGMKLMKRDWEGGSGVVT